MMMMRRTTPLSCCCYNSSRRGVFAGSGGFVWYLLLLLTQRISVVRPFLHPPPRHYASCRALLKRPQQKGLFMRPGDHQQAASNIRLSSSSSSETESSSDTPSMSAGNNISTVGSASLEQAESTIRSPVLQQVWPAMVEHCRQYGHANIPLGSAAGRQCVTLRRLHTQHKLVETDVDLLDLVQFTWHSLEDVARTADFDDMMGRLNQYASAHDRDVSPPKKYAADPELGAWITGLRRLGKDQVDPSHVKRLNDLNFQWTSPRGCGSQFMLQYKSVICRLEAGETGVLDEPPVQAWIQAQRAACRRGTLSNTRQHYMETLVGTDWMVE